MTAPTSTTPGASATDTAAASTAEGQAPETTASDTSTAATDTAAAPTTGPTAPAKRGDEKVQTASREVDATTTAASKPTEGKDAPAGAAAAEKVEDLPGWAQKEIAKLRKGEGDYRAKAKTAEETAAAEKKQREDLLEGLAKTLGLKDDDENNDLSKLTPERLAEIVSTKDEELSKRDQRISALLVERAAEKAARKAGADGDRMTDSRKFSDALSKLDMSSDKFPEQLDALVKQTLEEHPEYKLAPAARAAAPSGGQFAGGPSGRPDPESMSVDDHRKAVAEARK